MGNKQTTSQPSVLSNNYSWETVQKNGAYSVVRCNNTGAIGQMYRVNMDQWKQEVQKYQFRKDNDQFLVGVYSVAKNKGQFICSTTQTINVVTERMPYILTDFGQLQYQQALYVLLQVVSGMKLIYGEDKTISFDQNQVFVNEKGQVKIWINENLGLNTSQNRQQIEERNLIALIFKTIQNRIQAHSIPQQYYQIKNQFAPKNFSAAQFFAKRVKFEHAPHVNKLVLPGQKKKKQVSRPIPILPNVIEQRQPEFLMSDSQVSTKNPALVSMQPNRVDNNPEFLLPDSRLQEQKSADNEVTSLRSLKNSRALSIRSSRVKSEQDTEQKSSKIQKKLPPLPPNRVKSIGKCSSKENAKLVIQNSSQLTSPQYSEINQQLPRMIQPSQIPILMNSPKPLSRENSQRSISKSRVQILNSPRVIRVVQQPIIVHSKPIQINQPYRPIHQQIGSENVPGITTHRQGFKVVFNNSNSQSIQRRVNSRQKSFEKPNRIRERSIQKVTQAHKVAQKISFGQQQPSLNRVPKINFTFGSSA